MSPQRARERWLVVGASLLVVAAYVAIAAAHGALGASRNDDWTYYRVAFDLSDTGKFLPDPYTRTMLLGQVVLAQPVLAIWGHSITALQILVAMLAAIGLVASYAIVRSFLPPWSAAFSIGCLALGPLYGSLATTFMSDVPSFAVQSVALWVGLRAVLAERRALIWLAGSLAVSLVGFSIREYAVGSALAVVLAFILVRREKYPRVQVLAVRSRFWRLRAGQSREHVLALSLGMVWLVAAASLYLWRSHLLSAGSGGFLGLPSLSTTVKNPVQIVYTAAALLAPVIILSWRRAWLRSHWVMVLAGTAIALPIELGWRKSALLGNYFTQTGSYTEALVGTPPITVPVAVWTVIVMVMVAGSITLLDLMLSIFRGWLSRTRVRSASVLESRPAGPAPRPGTHHQGDPAATLSGIFGILTFVIAFAISGITAGFLFDRYLIAGVPYLAAWILWWGRRAGTLVRLRPAGAVVMALWALVGLHQVDTAATLDGAKWRMGETLVKAGYEAETIDAGLEWFGLHQPGSVLRLDYSRWAGYGFWVSLFDEPRVCVIVQYDSPTESGTDFQQPTAPASTPVARVSARSALGARYNLVAYKADLRC